tara:strand:- start:10899 stop:12677 length:1779 start_codon:yes stop_codon:yes gene_type:complete
MKYIEIAVGTPRNRGVLIPKVDLVNYITNKDPLYRSMYLYDETAKRYITQQGSVRNYLGTRYIDNILIDIDKKDNTDEFTLDKVRNFLHILEDEYSINPRKATQTYFSGSGYHISMPESIFHFIPSIDLPFFVKETMKLLFEGIDFMIYMTSGIYRVQHTVNKKTGLYKIPLTLKEVYNSTPDDIKHLASTQRLDYAYAELLGDGELEDRVITETPRIKSFKAVVEPTTVVPCVQRMLAVGPSEGSRHVTTLRIASHFRRNGIPSEYTKNALLHWNNNSMEESHIIRNVEHTYDRGYKYSCNDDIMKQYCRTNCIYFKRKDYDVDVKDAATLQEEYIQRLSTDFVGRTLNMSAMLGLDESIDSTIYPGELMTIFGPTGSNKTTFASNLVLGVDMAKDCINANNQISTLFLSLELSAWYMHRRHLQIIAGLTKDEVNENPADIYECHKELLQHIVVQTVSPTLDQIQTKIRELNPAVVVVDYIDLVETPPHIRGEYEQIKYISHNLSSMAVNMDVIIIQISQVSREYSRADALDLYAGKGSGAIENASRKVIGLTGQASTDIKKVELLKNTDGELFAIDMQWRPSFRLRRIYE